MADIKNKNELKRRTELFLDEFSHDEYVANEEFCKETMQMMREFIGRASHLLDCKEEHIKKVKRNAKKERDRAIEEFAEELKRSYQVYDIDFCLQNNEHFSHEKSCLLLEGFIDEIAESMKGEKE